MCCAFPRLCLVDPMAFLFESALFPISSLFVCECPPLVCIGACCVFLFGPPVASCWVPFRLSNVPLISLLSSPLLSIAFLCFPVGSLSVFLAGALLSYWIPHCFFIWVFFIFLPERTVWRARQASYNRHGTNCGHQANHWRAQSKHEWVA